MADNTAGMELPIGVSENRLLQQLARIEKKVLETQNKAAKGFVKSNQKAVESFKGLSNSARGNIQNVSYQFQDLAVQISGGTSAARALGQQLPQLLSGFGALGAVIGVVAAVAVPLAGHFLDMGEKGEDLEKQIEKLKKAVSDYRSAAEEAVIPTADLAKKYGTATEAARQFLRALEDINGVQAAEKLKSSIDTITESFGKLSAENLNPNARLLDLTSGLNIGGYAIEAINNLKEKLGATTGEAVALAGALDALQNAEGAKAQADAAAALLTALEDALGPYENMNDEARSLYASVRDAGDAAGDMQGAADGAANSIANAASEASALVAQLSAAVRALGQIQSGIASLDISNSGDRARLAALKAGKSKAEAEIAGKVQEKRLQEAAAFGSSDKIVRDQAAASLKEFEDKLRQQAALDAQIAALTKPPKSGGKSKKEKPGLFTASDEELQNIERQIELLGKTKSETAALEAKWKLLDEAKKRGIDLDSQVAGSGETVREQIDRQAQAIGELTAKYEQARERAQFFDQAQQTLKGGLVDAIVEGKNLSGVLEELAKSLAKAAVQAALFGDGPLGGGGSGLLGSLVSGLFGGARASGGPVTAGTPYLVNENTPNSEVFVPSSNGAILNVPQAQAALRGGGGVVRVQVEGGDLVLTDSGQIAAKIRVSAVQSAAASVATSKRQFGSNAQTYDMRGTT
ncbi:hypothetical protein DEM26_18230 [Thioclava sp. NG1]|uniref:hypothetical protein n=1 Tax=Thioclava sp. NG1 TaxID=2182426 RepID=UPI000D61644A|nr:hypothetical protein [Thioclava sp. NG1]PWE48486.1 hypothetical protein DEM26_18230 [Thioclava sp. NG1]